MKLRNQFLTLSLATLLVPWFGWKLVQELERFLRAGQESALLASAHTIARALPAEYQSELVFGRERLLPLRDLSQQPHLDGYADDWPESSKASRFQSDDGQLALEVLAGRYAGQVYLLCRVEDATPRDPDASRQPGGGLADGLMLFLRTPRDMIGFRVQSEAQGPLLLSSQNEGGGQIEGFWLERGDGYQVELSLPPGSERVDVAIGAQDISIEFGTSRITREAGTLEQGVPASWLRFGPQDAELGSWLGGVIPPATRAWVIDRHAWVVGDSGPAPVPPGRELSFAERILYRAIAGSRTEVLAQRPDQLVRFDEGLVDIALTGEEARHWGQDPDNALVRNTVAVPVDISGGISGGVVLEANSDGMLLVTNRVLGRLLLSTLLLTVGITAGLWYFATRLSRRVQRLSGAVSEAMDEPGKPGELPMTADRDELGELARNNARLLRAVSGYTSYLQKLASRLSHELKTPLAITRSSLDNLASKELDEEATRYVQRAREGLDRQSAIVSAMSEANRLEAAVKSAEWESVDLVEVISHCAEAYRGVHPDRRIDFTSKPGSLLVSCAPDLLAQALDKLVENAISLTGPQERVEVGVRGTADGVTIFVRNSGTRLPEGPEDQLFDSLVTKRDRGGGSHLGLGLHIVRLVAEAHGGTASAQNLGNGSGVEFSLELPGSR